MHQLGIPTVQSHRLKILFNLSFPPISRTKNVRDTPNFLYAALDTATCAPFIKERRMKFADPRNSTGNRGYGAPTIASPAEGGGPLGSHMFIFLKREPGMAQTKVMIHNQNQGT